MHQNHCNRSRTTCNIKTLVSVSCSPKAGVPHCEWDYSNNTVHLAPLCNWHKNYTGDSVETMYQKDTCASKQSVNFSLFVNAFKKKITQTCKYLLLSLTHWYNVQRHILDFHTNDEDAQSWTESNFKLP